MDNPKIDQCILLANYIIIFVSTDLRFEQATLSIGSNGQERDATKVVHLPSTNTSVFMFAPSSNTWSDFSRITVSIFNEKAELCIKDDNITIETVLQPKCIPYIDKLVDVYSNNVDLPNAVSLGLKALSAGADGKKYAIDNAYFLNGYLVVTGWIENAAAYEINIFSEDMSYCVTSDRFFYHSRSDVTEALSKIDVPIATSRHGFICVSTEKCNYNQSKFKIFVKSDHKTLFVGGFEITEQADRLSIASIYQIQSNGSSLDSNLIRSVIRPLLTTEVGNIGYKTAIVSSTHENPILSIIIPFYHEWFFIRALSRLHAKFPKFVEWIYVCDDSITAKEVARYLFLRTDEVQRNIKVVVNHKNYGYSISNNIGVKHAKARTLLFMNSDIWIDDVNSILEALRLVTSRVFGIVGFRLLFEDGSLQHDGIIFRRNTLFGNLFVADHPMKGLPPSSGFAHLQDIDAVTGALMMVDRHTFERIGGFDKNYIRGDFEDVDLCLGFRKVGKRVGISRADGNFHLERQSIRAMAASDHRTLVTLTNCVYFNDKWAEYLNTGRLEFLQ